MEGFFHAAADQPELLHRVVDAVNDNTLALVDLAAQSPAAVVVMGDNISGDVQPPPVFAAWSAGFYREAIRRLHAAGKKVAVHIDGRLRGALRMVRDGGADAADAVTPQPMGDLTPGPCRDDVDAAFILSGGVSPDLWLPTVPLPRFERAVLDWLELRRQSSALIANAGDQVPPGADARGRRGTQGAGHSPPEPVAPRTGLGGRSAVGPRLRNSPCSDRLAGVRFGL